MADLLLVAGVALCALSVVVALVQMLQTRPPRAAAILLVLGLAGILAATIMGPGPQGLADVAGAWHRLTGGAPAAQ